MNKKPFWEESCKGTGPANTFGGGNPSQEFYDLVKVLPRGGDSLVDWGVNR